MSCLGLVQEQADGSASEVRWASALSVVTSPTKTKGGKKTPLGLPRGFDASDGVGRCGSWSAKFQPTRTRCE